MDLSASDLNKEFTCKSLIIPLLNGFECGGFFLYATQSIYIQDYTFEENVKPNGLAIRNSPFV
jgi:hypothetical protein